MITSTLLKQLFSSKNPARLTQVAFFCIAITMASGCAERKVRVVPWATAVLVRPNPPVVRVDSTAAADMSPDFRIEPPANNGKLFSSRPVPLRPRASAPVQPETVDAAKATGLVPELSAQETAVAKQQVAESIAIAQRNLATALGRKLSPAQSDIVSKISSFLAEAHEASGDGDWARARNLAKKAQILSDDLVSSL
jgi:hypothetical protein